MELEPPYLSLLRANRRYAYVSIAEMLEGVPRTTLNDRQEDLDRRLFPKTVRLDRNMPARLTEAWVTMQQIGGKQLRFMDPGFGLSTDRIRNESQAREHLKDRLFLPLRRFFDGLIWTAFEQGDEEHDDANRLLRALRQAYKTTITTEDRRFLIQTPAHDAVTIAEGELDTGVLHREIALNFGAHDVVRSAMHSSSEVAPDIQHSVEEDEDMPFSRRIPDICLNWLGNDDAEATLAAGGIPFIAMEVKDPNKLSFADVHHYICNYDRCLQPFEQTEAAFFKQQQVMNIRWMLNSKQFRMLTKPRSFFSNLSRHFEYLFLNRLTYGQFSTGDLGVGMRLDWDHAEEPGQHLYVTLFNCTTNEMIPPWQSNSVQPRTLTSFVAAYGALQLQTGLIPMPRFVDVLNLLMDRHGLYENQSQVDSDYEDGSSTIRPPNPSRKRKAPEPEGPNHAVHQHEAHSVGALEVVIPAALDDLNRAFLNCIEDPHCKQEILRFLNIDETKYSIPFPKTELPKILCAAFPFRSDLVSSRRSLAHLRSKDLRFPKFTSIAGVSNFDDYDLFKWRTLAQGYVPRGLNERLAQRDRVEMELAQQCATHDRSPDKNMPPDPSQPERLDSIAAPPMAGQQQTSSSDSSATDPNSSLDSLTSTVTVKSISSDATIPP